MDKRYVASFVSIIENYIMEEEDFEIKLYSLLCVIQNSNLFTEVSFYKKVMLRIEEVLSSKDEPCFDSKKELFNSIFRYMYFNELINETINLGFYQYLQVFN